MLPTVSIVVPARNEEKVIGNCLDSLSSIDYPKGKLEIVVLIDGSEDKTEEIAKKYKGVKVIVSDPKSCKGEAINSVLDLLKGEIIGIYDADCIIEKDCIKNAVKHFSNKKTIAVCGSLKSYNKDQNLITKALSIETCLSSFIEHLFQKNGSRPLFMGKNSFIRKEVLKNIGGFDTVSLLEDADLTFKLRKYKYRVVFEPTAVTWHEEPSSVKSFMKQRLRWARGIIILKKKYKSTKDFINLGFHGVYFYSTPMTLFLITLFFIFMYFNIHFIFFIPFLALILLNVYIFIKSHLFYKKPVKDLLFLPIFFILTLLQIFIFFKAWYYNILGKDLEWYKSDRTGLILS